MNDSEPISRSPFIRLSDTGLRILYSAAAFLSLLCILVSCLAYTGSGLRHSDGCYWTTVKIDRKVVLKVSSIVPGEGAEKAGVHVGDLVIAINGVSIPTDPQVEESLPLIAQKILDETPVTHSIPYTVERDGRRIDLPIRLVEEHEGASNNPVLLIFPAFTLIWLAVGVLVVLGQPRGRVQRLFFFTGLTAAFAFAVPGNLRQGVLVLGFDLRSGQALAAVVAFLGSFFYAAWIRFCSVFPIDRNLFTTRGRKLIPFIPVALTAGLGLSLLYLSIENALRGDFLTILSGLIIAGAILSYVLYFFGGIWLLIEGYRRMPNTPARHALRGIIVAAVLAGLVPFYFTALSIAAATSSGFTLSRAYLYPGIVILALPISFGYAIFKHQIMDFRLVIRTTVVYAVTMGLIAGLYVGASYALGKAFGAIAGGEFAGTVQFAGLIAFLLLFDPVKRQLQTAIENRFFPQRRDYSAYLGDFSGRVANATTTGEVATVIATTLDESLGTASLVFFQEGDGDAGRWVTRGGDAPGLSPSMMGYLRQLVGGSRGLISIELLSDPQAVELRSAYAYVIGLYARGETIGWMLIGRPGGGDPLQGRQGSFITGVTVQGAAALESVRLFDQELSRRRYQEELETARRIQQGLLPSVLPELPGLSLAAISRPAQAVGGDYFNVIPLDDSRLLVIVADVSGKGLPASLYMAELHGMVCIASTTCRTASEILVKLNEHLFREMKRGMFVTATVLLFDTAAESVDIARAGHTPIMQCTATGTSAMTPAGMGLGMAQSEHFARTLQPQKIRYTAGDTFVLFSDGLSEAMNARREEFGDERLLDTLKGARDRDIDSLQKNILDGVEDFRDGAEQNDDITLVVVRTGSRTCSEEGKAAAVEATV